MATPKTVAFQTLGCKLNFSETSTLAQRFRDKGYGVVPDTDDADIFVLNTCSVTDFADRKCRKAVRQALAGNPEARVVVTGCYAQLKPQEIADIPGVDLVLGAGEKFRIVEFVEALDKSADRDWVQAGQIDHVNTFTEAYSTTGRTRSFLKVQDGCDYKCSFCTIPMARGKSRSNSVANVVATARQLGESGIQEIVMTGVNIGDFRHVGDGQTDTFLDLIRALDQVTSVPRFRISSIEPNLCSDAIIDFVAGSERFMPHFHMPLQSGNDKQLRAMRRRYRSDLYAQRVSRIKEVMPYACVGMDVITGFPGETDDDFQQSFDFIHGLDVSYLHVFTYSERANTLAAEMQGSVPMEVRRQRNARLRTLSMKKKIAFYRQHLGQVRTVLTETAGLEGSPTGFTDNYIKVRLSDQHIATNTLVEVELGGWADHGQLVDARVQSTASV